MLPSSLQPGFWRSLAGCHTKMCFNGDESGPDIWLTVENGRYVPAPPMVYVPGLRQAQHRLQRNENIAWAPPPPTSNIVRLPIGSANSTSYSRHPTHMSASLGTSCSASHSTEVRPEHSNRVSSSSLPSGRNSTLPMPTPNQKPAVTTRLPESPSEKSSNQLSRALAEAEVEQHQESLVGTNEGSRGAGHCTVSCSANDTPYSPPTSSSSLRSILKTPSSMSKSTVPERVAKTSGRADHDDVVEEDTAPRPKMRKSVSFADVAESRPLRPKCKTTPQATAAEEGAAIAK